MLKDPYKLSLTLLGSFRCLVNGEDRSKEFRTKKERALLSYLVVESDRSHRREALGERFWPGKPEGYARTNLRQALSGIRRAIQHQDGEEPYLLISDDFVRINPESKIEVDSKEFDLLFEGASSHPHTSIETCGTCVSAIRKLVDLYKGDFLGEYLLLNTQAFQEWVLFQREHYFRRLLASIHILISYYEEIGEIKQALDFAYRQASLAHLEESAHRQLMQLLALDGRRSAAIEQYQTCCRILSDELGVSPDLETIALYERIKAGLVQNVSRPLTKPKSTNLPVQFAKFVGREDELAWALESMKDPVNRLLTVTGISGVGKTRFSIQLGAKVLNIFTDGVWFVPLNSIHAIDLIPHEIARVLKVDLGESDPRWDLINFLSDKSILLVIDNFEHLLDGTTFLLEILQESPGVKIIVTSQQRLSYQAAQTLELKGLPYPEADDPDWKEYPAVELFLDRARRNQPAFQLVSRDIPYLAGICKSVDGNPLGLELAAAGMRFYSCEQIAKELEHNLDILATSMQDVPKRHRSLRAAFDHSWQILSDIEKDAFRRLSIYQGEFSIDDAVATTGTSIGVISKLADRSLIQKNSSGYYLIQPILRQYAAEKLEEIYEPNLQDGILSLASQDRLSVTRDPITELPNKVLFHDLFKQALAVGHRRGKFVALMIVEFDHIDALKRDYSSDEIGVILKQLTKILTQSVRDSDTITHLTPGKFALILESMSQYQDGVFVTQKIRSSIDDAFIVLPDGSKANISLGISIFPDDSEDIAELLNLANNAMNKAKIESVSYNNYRTYEKPVFLTVET